jgi:hypothetical protein
VVAWVTTVPVQYNPDDFKRITSKLGAVLTGMKPDFEFVGGRGAEAIVQTTLAGIGEGDQAFAPYSPGYIELLNAVGGKPRGTVDLRGVFYHQGQRRFRGRRNLGQGRRAYISVQFGARTAPGQPARQVGFTARTRETRPQRGITDPLSEMSLDLVKVEATDTGFRIVYAPRVHPYMILHNEGGARGGKVRKWFTLGKAAVVASMTNALKNVIRARVLWFNDHGSTVADRPKSGGRGSASGEAPAGPGA